VEDRIALFCKGVVAGPGRILMLAHVFLPDGSKAAGASIEALWAQSASDPGHGYRERARTDTSGTFHVCGLRGGDTVQVTATLDSLDAQVRGGFRAYEDLTLFVVPLRLVVPPFRSRIMRVVDDQGNPIRGAWLLDEDTGEARATTNANGEASIGWMPRGRTGVRVERAGYEATTTTVMIAPDDESVVTVRLKRTP
jgi:Carboxypeptidase regulatory-like domain